MAKPGITRHRDRGFALLTVIWLALIITVIAMGVTRESRIGARYAAVAVDEAKARAVADAGLAWAMHTLSARVSGVAVPPAPDALRAGIHQSPRLDGTPAQWIFDDVALDLRIFAERGKIDLLAVRKETLEDLLKTVGVPHAAPIAALLRRRRSFREGTSLVDWRVGGRRLNSISDLALALNLTSSDIAVLRRYVTIHGYLRSPDPLVAPEWIFDRLPLDGADRRRFVAERRGRTPARSTGIEIFTVEMRATTPSGLSVRKAVLVEYDQTGLPRVLETITEPVGGVEQGSPTAAAVRG